MIAADSVDLKASSGFGAVSCPGFPGGDWPLRVVWFACVMPMVLAKRFVKPVRGTTASQTKPSMASPSMQSTKQIPGHGVLLPPLMPPLPRVFLQGKFNNGSRWSPVVPWSSRRRAISGRTLPRHRSPRWCRHDDGNVEARVFSASAAVSPSEHEYKAQVSIKAVPPCRQFVRRWNLRHCGGL